MPRSAHMLLKEKENSGYSPNIHNGRIPPSSERVVFVNSTAANGLVICEPPALTLNVSAEFSAHEVHTSRLAEVTPFEACYG
jgi:hypothetical protein